ncbi:MAG: hypothetical protein ABSG67_03545 [Thermoguttaceae bacterium]
MNVGSILFWVIRGCHAHACVGMPTNGTLANTQLYFRSLSNGNKSLFARGDTTGIIVTAG